jgi:hypothetical protein
MAHEIDLVAFQLIGATSSDNHTLLDEVLSEAICANPCEPEYDFRFRGHAIEAPTLGADIVARYHQSQRMSRELSAARERRLC